MKELSDHTEAAVKFAIENPTTVESNAVIIGAWNENDEGHWLVDGGGVWDYYYYYHLTFSFLHHFLLFFFFFILLLLLFCLYFVFV